MTALVTPGPHAQMRGHWLALSVEEVLDPKQPTLDAHDHLWDRPEGRYRAEALLADVPVGHEWRATLYVQCHTGYREAPGKAPASERYFADVRMLAT